MTTKELKPNDLGVSEMTCRELENIATYNAGIVGSLKPGQGPRAEPLADRHGFHFFWIGTDGRIDQGLLAMRGTNVYTREIIRRGKILRLRDMGATEQQAELIIRNRLVKYAREERVIAAALRTYADPIWDMYPGGEFWLQQNKLELQIPLDRFDAVKCVVEVLKSARP